MDDTTRELRDKLLITSVHSESSDELSEALDLAREEIDRLDGEVRKRAVLLRKHEWDAGLTGESNPICPECHNYANEGHTIDCTWDDLQEPLTVTVFKVAIEEEFPKCNVAVLTDVTWEK